MGINNRDIARKLETLHRQDHATARSMAAATAIGRANYSSGT
jgi:hypothetical protein